MNNDPQSAILCTVLRIYYFTYIATTCNTPIYTTKTLQLENEKVRLDVEGLSC